MIQLREKPPVPPYLTSAAVIAAKDALRRSYEENGEVTAKDFKSHIWRHDDVRLELHRYQNGKCCYCERKREPKREPDIEHFRPKAKVTKDPEHPGYWWLAYEWSNLYFSCKACNEDFKKNHFPLANDDLRARREVDDHAAESPILPDPAREDPEQLIAYSWDVLLEEAWPVPRDRERGSVVICLLGLDRTLLNKERGDLLALLEPIAMKMTAAIHFGKEDLKQRTSAQIRRQTARDQQFAGFRRWYFTQIGLGEYISTD